MFCYFFRTNCIPFQKFTNKFSSKRRLINVRLTLFYSENKRTNIYLVLYQQLSTNQGVIKYLIMLQNNEFHNDTI